MEDHAELQSEQQQVLFEEHSMEEDRLAMMQ